MFKYKQKITGQTGNDGEINVKIMVPLKYLSNFRRTLEMLLTNCELNLILTWSEKCVITSNTAANQVTTFAIAGTKLYVPVVTQDNAKLLQQLKSGFKRTINLNKYQSKVTLQALNPNLDYVIEPSFQEVNRLFGLSFENSTDRNGTRKISFNCRN